MQNVMEAVIVDHPLGLPPSLRGDDHVRIVIQSIGHWLAEMARREKPQRFMCLDCDTTFHARRMPEAFGMAVPLIAEEGRPAWTTGTCRRCAEKEHAALLQTLMERMRAYYPDLTIIQSGQA